MKKAIVLTIAALALSGCTTTEPADEPRPAAETRAVTEAVPQAWMPNDPAMCEADHSGSRLDPTKSRVMCPDRVERDEREAALSKALEEGGPDPETYRAQGRTESWSFDPAAGGSNDGSDSGRCVYDPTMNWDWHDDMVCDGVRLYLLPNDEYVTRDEIEQAAREWMASH